MKYTEEYLRNKKFNKLTFISKTEKRKNHTYCLWKCDCGKEVKILQSAVVTGNTKSCFGCSISKGKLSNHWKGYEEISGQHWNIICDGAKNRKIEVKITIENIWQKFIEQNRCCALTGESLQFDSQWRAKDCTASLDRIDSSKGYTIDNVQWVHKKINMMKNCYEQNDFIEWCKKVANYNKSVILST